MKRLFIDSDLFVRDLRYPRDARTAINSRFLERVKKGTLRGATSIFNVLEVCGILSHNYSVSQLTGLYADFCSHYRLQVFFPADEDGGLQYDIAKIFTQMQKKQSLGDAQIGYVVERFSNQISSFVSWNAAHFVGKFSVPVVTPEHF